MAGLIQTEMGATAPEQEQMPAGMPMGDEAGEGADDETRTAPNDDA